MRPTKPGTRWLRGFIALNTCVNVLAPASSAAMPVSKVEAECPKETTIPCSFDSFLMRFEEPSSSGANVTILIMEDGFF